MNVTPPIKQRGFSITEMLVAAVIGLILTAGAISMLVTSKQTYVVQDDLARIQEGARFAMDLMLADIRAAGYFGCHNSMGNVTNNLNGAANGVLFDTARAIEALEDGVDAWAPSNNTTDRVITTLDGGALGDTLRGSDAITIRRAGGIRWPATANMNNLGDPVTINHAPINGVSINTGDLLVLSDCASADIFRATNTPPASAAAAINHNAGANPEDNATNLLNKRYDTTAFVSPLATVRYFIGRDATGGPANPSLFREIVANGVITTQELVPGVESMQITYGIDNTGDNIPDSYVAANAGALGMVANNWNAVEAVRVALLLRSEQANSPDLDRSTYLVNGQALFGGAAPNDNRRRRVMMSAIFMRNNTQ